jgi:hypothetical protein
LLDRVFGKPTQILAADTEIVLQDMTLEELRANLLADFAALFPELENSVKKPIENCSSKRLALIARKGETTSAGSIVLDQ